MVCLFLAAPYIVINAISGFKMNHSTLSQRVWMMLWIAYPSFLSFLIAALSVVLLIHLQIDSQTGTHRLWRVCRFSLLLTSGCVAVGGLVTLSNMILENGMCELY